MTGSVTAAAAGEWQLGDLTVNRMGFGAMRLPQTGRALIADAVPGDRGRAISVLATPITWPPTSPPGRCGFPRPR